MFRNNKDIYALVNLLKSRDVYLYHACQFVDYESYLQIGGIPSHDCLEKQGVPYTSLVTDNNDKKNGVWDKVFVNFEDTGTIFARGQKGTPNPYGPILFKIQPEALLDGLEVAITLRSAGAEDFDRDKEALTSTAEVDRIFLYPLETQSKWLGTVRFRDNLREAFPNKPRNLVESTEIHCIFPDGYLPVKYVEEVIVDPYEICGNPLICSVNEARKGKNAPFAINPRRNIRDNRKSLYRELAHILMVTSSPRSVQDILRYERASPTLKNWAKEIFAQGLEWQYGRFVEYLYDGTLIPLSSEQPASIRVQSR